MDNTFAVFIVMVLIACFAGYQRLSPSKSQGSQVSATASSTTVRQPEPSTPTTLAIQPTPLLSTRFVPPGLKSSPPATKEALVPEANDDLCLITGKIIDQPSQDPLGKVHVTITDRNMSNRSPLEEYTDRHGQFWQRVQRGVYLVTFERAGYLKVVKECHVQRGGVCGFENLELQKLADH